ncbi:MAG: histidinol dehydrogenase [Planctomycetota bacterium]
MRWIQVASDRGTDAVQWLRSGRGTDESPESRLRVERLVEELERKERGLFRQQVEADCGFDPGQESTLVAGSRLLRARSQVAPAALENLARRMRALRMFQLRTLPAHISFCSEGGFRIGIKSRPLRRVGILLPRNDLALPLLLALAVPARVAGVPEILVAMAPAQDGCPPPAVLAGCEALGLRRVLRLAGAPAVLALATGTEETPAADLVLGEDGLDALECMRIIGGQPTDATGELLVLTDGSRIDPAELASRLLEHALLGGGGLRAVLSTSADFLGKLERMLEECCQQLPRRSRPELRGTFSAHGRLLEIGSLRRGVDMINELAPDRLFLAVRTPRKLSPMMERVGVLHIGEVGPPDSLDRLHTLGMRKGWIPTASRFLRSTVTVRTAAEARQSIPERLGAGFGSSPSVPAEESR